MNEKQIERKLGIPPGSTLAALVALAEQVRPEAPWAAFKPLWLALPWLEPGATVEQMRYGTPRNVHPFAETGGDLHHLGFLMDRDLPTDERPIVYVNPNSVAHLSLALSYPNDYDLARAAEDGRDALGGDIMIHGGSTSSGCLAMGDEAAEELFVLAADAGWERAVVVLSPVDFRRSILPVDYRAQPAWVEDLYARLQAELQAFPVDRAFTSNGLH